MRWELIGLGKKRPALGGKAIVLGHSVSISKNKTGNAYRSANIGQGFITKSRYFQIDHKVSQLNVGVSVGEKEVERNMISLLWNQCREMGICIRGYTVAVPC